MKEQKSFSLINESSDTILFDVHDLIEPGKYWFGPALWCRQGSYCIIPTGVMMNLLDNAEIYAQMDSGKTINPKLKLVWSQGIPISNLAGRAMIGE